LGNDLSFSEEARAGLRGLDDHGRRGVGLIRVVVGVLAQVVRVWDLGEVADVYHFAVPRAAQALLRSVYWLRHARVVVARYLTDALVAFGGRLKSARPLGGRLLLARFVAPLLSVSLRVESHQKYFWKRQLLEGRRHTDFG
jgi:hypothetical protein